MAAFKSGLSYEKLKAIDSAGALDQIRRNKGSAKVNRGKWIFEISYRVPDPSRPGKTKQAFISKRASEVHLDDLGKVFSEKEIRTKGAEVCADILAEAKPTGRNALSEAKAKKLLDLWRVQVIEDVESIGGFNFNYDPTFSVRTCVEHYIEAKADLKHSSASTYRTDAKRIYRYPFASRPMIDLKNGTVRAWVNDLMKTCSGKTVRNSFILLDAVCEEVLGNKNPCTGVKLPPLSHKARTNKNRPNALTLDGLARTNTILDGLDKDAAANDDTDVISLAARLALNSGMRQGEICGLRWGDVDLDGRRLFVANAIAREDRPVVDENGEYLRDGNGNIVTRYVEYDETPKTEKSRRTIPLNGAICELLATHKKRVAVLLEKLEPKARKRPNIEGLYVFGDARGGFLSPRRLSRRWASIAAKYEILGTEGKPISFHDLRHTAATRLLNAGVDLATVSHILGHANAAITAQMYVTSDEDSKRKAIDDTEGIFNARKSGAVIQFDPDRTGTSG